jgi:hypothetical protein
MSNTLTERVTETRITRINNVGHAVGETLTFYLSGEDSLDVTTAPYRVKVEYRDMGERTRDTHYEPRVWRVV